MKDHSAYTDEQLLLLLAGSDQQAFTALYNRYHTGIYNYQLAFVKIPSIAEDLTQEVFLRVSRTAIPTAPESQQALAVQDCPQRRA